LDYRGIPVLSSYAPLRDEQDSWAILAEIDAAEAFAPVGRLRAQVFGLTGLVAMLFLALSLGLTRMIARNETLVLRREQVDRDLRLARSIQQGLLPKAAPSLDGYQIAGWSQPAEETGGDYFDWQTLPSGQLALSLADVTGHGIGPALVTAVCRAYTRASLPEADDLGVVMSRINELLHEDLPEDRFVTFVAALLDGQSHELHYLSAGHGPIVICRAATGELDVRGAHDIPFGLIGDQRYGSGDIVELEPGDVVVLITDGFFEWPAPDGTIFGLDRLRETLARVHTKSADDIIQALYQEVLTYAQGTSQDDDLTAVVVKRIATD
ncbi:MAG: PP2C family protein-serine/threonine phosphatase, partial [Planctomycetota bacterium]